MSNMKWIDMHCDTLSEMKKQGIPSLNQHNSLHAM